jgi:hypothetical protein
MIRFCVLTFTDSVEIKADPEAVFAAISHLERMGEFSTENNGGTWVKGSAGPGLGAHFRGTNGNGKKTWSTNVEVVTFTPPSSFAFEVTAGPVKVARWSYELEAIDGGTRVTESWLDRRNGLVRKLTSRIEVDREGANRNSVRATLDALKVHLES